MRRLHKRQPKHVCMCKDKRTRTHSDRDWKRLKEDTREMRDAVRRDA